jgi:V/A-type H+-transporting ATPase subunit D
MIHPTRTNLLLLKEKSASIENSISILTARRQALIREFLDTSLPFMRSREDIRGKSAVESLTCSAARDVSVDIIEKRIWGLRYMDILLKESLVRDPDQRGYDLRTTTPHIEEGIYLFEKVLESMVGLAAYENKLKRLGDEITRISRKIKVLEERVLPGLKRHIRTIAQYIGEREREAYYRLKRFKGITDRKRKPGA